MRGIKGGEREGKGGEERRREEKGEDGRGEMMEKGGKCERKEEEGKLEEGEREVRGRKEQGLDAVISATCNSDLLISPLSAHWL